MAAATCARYESHRPYCPNPFTTAVICCSDGRLDEHITSFLGDGLKITSFDRIAVPGGAACLAGHWRTWREEESLAGQLAFLIKAHSIRRIILVAHQDCGHYLHRLGFRGPELIQQQREDLLTAARRIHQLAPTIRAESYLALADSRRLTFNPVGG